MKTQKDPFELPKIENSQEGPKTLKGIEGKIATGDGRKSLKKQIKEAKEAALGKKKKRGRKKKK